MQFSIVLKSLINLTGVTHIDLAECVGYHSSYISKWIKGTHLPTSKSLNLMITNCSRLFADRIEDAHLEKDFHVLTANFLFFKEYDTIEQTIAAILKEAYEASKTPEKSKKREEEPSSSRAHAIVGFEPIAEFVLSRFDAFALRGNGPLEIRTNLNLFGTAIPLAYNELGQANVEINGVRLYFCLPSVQAIEMREGLINTLFGLVLQSSSPELHVSEKIDDMPYTFLLCVDAFVCYFIMDDNHQIQTMFYSEELDLCREVYRESAHLFEDVDQLLKPADTIWPVLDDVLAEKERVFFTSFYANEVMLTHPLIESLQNRDAITEKEAALYHEVMDKIDAITATLPITYLVSESLLVDFMRHGEFQLGKKQLFLNKSERKEMIDGFITYLDSPQSSHVNIYVLREYMTIYKRNYVQYSILQLGKKLFLERDLATLYTDLPLFYEVTSDKLATMVEKLFKDLFSNVQSVMSKDDLVKYLSELTNRTGDSDDF